MAGHVFLAILLAFGLVWVGAPPATAYGGPYPVIQVSPNDGSGSVTGGGWSEDTTAGVTVRVNSSIVGTAPVGPQMWGPHAFILTLSTRPSVGDVVTVTGNSSDYSRTLQVIDLRVDHFDIPDSTLSGTKGRASDGWGDLRISTGSMLGGGNPQVVIPADASASWSAALTPDYFDMMAGVGVTLWQLDPDGDTLQTMQSVPNPTIRIAAEGVMGNGWMPGSQVTISLDDDPNAGLVYPYTYTRSVNADGYFWDGPPNDPQWQVIQPGWAAKVVGTYPTRDDGTVTKEVQFADLPIPAVTGNVVSGVVPGPLTATTVGHGSLVQTMATCPSMGTAPVNRSDLAEASSGAYSVDFGALAEQPWGWGGPCTDPLYYYGANVKDSDGDEVHFNWFVDSMFDETHPSLTADSPITDGQDFGIVGTGWDLTAMRIQQCAMAGDAVGDCDPTTTQLVTSYPDTGWPSGMARLDPSVYAKQVLDLSGGPVDCAEAPGTCAVVVTEMYRPDISAFDTLTYEVPYWVDLDVRLDTTGTIVKASGAATITGTVTASEPTGVHLYGELYQRLGRKVVSGGFDTWVGVDEPGQAVAWSVTVRSWNGLAFGAGAAEAVVTADLGDEGATDGATDTAIIRLVVPKAPKPPRR